MCQNMAKYKKEERDGMHEIKCPKCGEIFQVDETGYQHILQQVRDKEFEKRLTKELERREKELRDKQEQELQLLRTQSEKQTAEEMRNKDKLIDQRDRIIRDLEAKLNTAETEKQLAITQAVDKQKEELSTKNEEITRLKGELKNKETESRLNTESIQKTYEEKLRNKDDEIARIKEYKAKQSTKMVGESLEQYCSDEFNKIRMYAFPNAYFEKDNDAKKGSKGDFIYREQNEDGLEFLSIMFEMKNEVEETATKHKNEEFFKKLDKDRKEKNCEYAVLVSMLESDSELYNTGIVDVSHKYEKMYVVRPQNFIAIIGILRNAAKNSLQYRQELQLVQNQQLDVQNFEKNMKDFKDAFNRNYRLASDRFTDAIKEIDKSIDHLQKIKEALQGSERNLRLADDKLQDLSIKKLTKNAPSVRAMFEEVKVEDDVL